MNLEDIMTIMVKAELIESANNFTNKIDFSKQATESGIELLICTRTLKERAEEFMVKLDRLSWYERKLFELGTQYNSIKDISKATGIDRKELKKEMKKIKYKLDYETI